MQNSFNPEGCRLLLFVCDQPCTSDLVSGRATSLCVLDLFLMEGIHPVFCFMRGFESFLEKLSRGSFEISEVFIDYFWPVSPNFDQFWLKILGQTVRVSFLQRGEMVDFKYEKQQGCTKRFWKHRFPQETVQTFSRQDSNACIKSNSSLDSMPHRSTWTEKVVVLWVFMLHT